jgi:hypothetical protein
MAEGEYIAHVTEDKTYNGVPGNRLKSTILEWEPEGTGRKESPEKK